MVVLNEIKLDPVVGQQAPAPAFREEAARVTKPARRDHLQPINPGFFNQHAATSGVSIRRSFTKLGRGCHGRIWRTASYQNQRPTAKARTDSAPPC
jgi:hypothetical protein